MARVTIVQQFDLTHDDGSMETFPPGSYDMEPELANHWYVAAHSDNPPPARPRHGTPLWARQQQAFTADQLTAQQQEDAVAQAAANAAREEFRKSGGRRRLRMPGEHVEGREGAEGEVVDADEQEERETQQPRSLRRRAAPVVEAEAAPAPEA